MTYPIINRNSSIVDENIDSPMFLLQMDPECLDCVFFGDVKFMESDFVPVGRSQIFLQLFYSFTAQIFVTSLKVVKKISRKNKKHVL